MALAVAPSGSTKGRFYCALCWLKNTEQSVWKSFAGGCDFQLLSVSNQLRQFPIIQTHWRIWILQPVHLFSPKIADSADSRVRRILLKWFRARVPVDMTTEPPNPDCSASRYVGQCHPIRTRVPMVSVSEYEIPVVTIVGTIGKNGSKLSGHHRFPENRSKFPHNHRFPESNPHLKYIL